MFEGNTFMLRRQEFSDKDFLFNYYLLPALTGDIFGGTESGGRIYGEHLEKIFSFLWQWRHRNKIMVANTKTGQFWTACKVFAPINTTGKVTKISNQSFIFISFQTFPRASLTEFIFMVLEALGKAAFHVKAEICQVFQFMKLFIMYRCLLFIVYTCLLLLYYSR